MRAQLVLPGTQTQTDPHALTSDDWYTPRAIVEWAIECMGSIDTDPAWSAQSMVHPTIGYTAQDDGLAQPWEGCVWLNPPYSDPAPWVRRASERKQPTMVLIKLDPATRMWGAHVWPKARAIVFFGRRLEFSRPDRTSGCPPWPSCVLYFGDGEVPLAKLRTGPWVSSVVSRWI